MHYSFACYKSKCRHTQNYLKLLIHYSPNKFEFISLDINKISIGLSLVNDPKYM